MKTKLLISILLLSPIILISQNQVKKFKATSLSVMPFFVVGNSLAGNTTDFRKLAPNSKNIPLNLDEYQTSSYYDYRSSQSGSSIILGFKLRNNEGTDYKANPVVRIGLSLQNSPNISINGFKESRHPHDTITHLVTGEKTPIDSISYSNINMFYDSKQLNIDASLLFSSSSKYMFSFFAGVGISVGASVTSNTSISTYHDYYFQTKNNTDSYSNQYYNGLGYSSNNKTDLVYNKTNFSYAAYIPLGLDLRMSNRHLFWKQVHLFYEMRPSLNILYIPETQSYVSTRWVHGFGLKIQWN